MTWCDRVIETMKEKGALRQCAACDARDFHVEKRSMPACGGSVEVALVVCKVCGLMRMHALELLGVE